MTHRLQNLHYDGSEQVGLPNALSTGEILEPGYQIVRERKNTTITCLGNIRKLANQEGPGNMEWMVLGWTFRKHESWPSGAHGLSKHLILGVSLWAHGPRGTCIFR